MVYGQYKCILACIFLATILCFLVLNQIEYITMTNTQLLSSSEQKHIQAITGCLLGGAVGDAYGLPFEGISASRIHKLFSPNNHYQLIPWLHGTMVSDDTEHALMTTQAYIASAGNPQKFRRSLRLRLMLWLMALPAGVGMATGRSIIKMWLGLRHTGVNSAGNGGAMRAAVLGVLCNDLTQLKQLITISTTLTHTNPQAVTGAQLIALLAWVEYRHGDWDTAKVMAWLAQHIDDDELTHLLGDYTPTTRHDTALQGICITPSLLLFKHGNSIVITLFKDLGN